MKKDVVTRATECESEIKVLSDKKQHCEEAYEKVQADFQEFVKSHMVEKLSD